MFTKFTLARKKILYTINIK